MGYDLVMPSQYELVHSFHPARSQRLSSSPSPSLVRYRVIMIVPSRLHWRRGCRTTSIVVTHRCVRICFYSKTSLAFRARSLAEHVFVVWQLGRVAFVRSGHTTQRVTCQPFTRVMVLAEQFGAISSTRLVMVNKISSCNDFQCSSGKGPISSRRRWVRLLSPCAHGPQLRHLTLGIHLACKFCRLVRRRGLIFQVEVVNHLFIKARILMRGRSEFWRLVTPQSRNAPVGGRRGAPRGAAFRLRCQITFVQLRGIRRRLILEVVTVHLRTPARAAIGRQG